MNMIKEDLYKKLCDEASIASDKQGPRYRVFDEFNHYLIELVVNECAKVLDEHESLNTWSKRYSQVIKEHFGI